MKKLMIAAAAAAMIGGVYAAPTFNPIECDDPINPEETCELMTFKLTASGKTVQDVNEGAYKAVTTLKISKGALVLIYNADCAEDGLCCYDTAAMAAQVKIGKTTKLLGVNEIEVGKWSVFGKNFEKAMNYKTEIKPGKSVKLESDLFLSIEDGENVLGEEDALNFWASAFGDFKFAVTKATKGTTGYCDNDPGTEGCDPVWTPGTYNGWFVGNFKLVNDMFACFNCDCGDYDIFGGTWKAVYQAKAKDVAAIAKLAGMTEAQIWAIWGEDLDEKDED